MKALIHDGHPALRQRDPERVFSHKDIVRVEDWLHLDGRDLSDVDLPLPCDTCGQPVPPHTWHSPIEDIPDLASQG